jgi:DNA topoisomerase-1
MTDDGAGISRHQSGTGFSYRDAAGKAVRDDATLARIHALVIPPAWTHVWISPIANGHIQATGRDARGRKQYRYHARWREVRDDNKYGRLTQFAATLPKIRARVQNDLAREGLPRERVLATIVRFLETTFIRVGNEAYARDNGSFGLTTLQDRHVHIEGAKIQFRFRGKSGKQHAIQVNDRRLARLVRRCRDLPGQDLFQFVDDAGEPQPVHSDNVNDYLRSASGEEFTAKDFRTWAGTLLAAQAFAASGCGETESEAKGAVVAAVKSVADRLGNTVSVCRKCYIHPEVLRAALTREFTKAWGAAQAASTELRGLRADENALLQFLKRSAP